MNGTLTKRNITSKNMTASLSAWQQKSFHSSFDEDRWNVIGMVEKVLFVVYTEITNDRIRIISARAAEKEEIDEYFSDYDLR